MKSLSSTSACRYCRHYQLEGRRGGTCLSLGVPVQGSWKACTLALPTFAPNWELFKTGMPLWENGTATLPTSHPLVAALNRQRLLAEPIVPERRRQAEVVFS